jgi:predicted MFS family arabinose efflux permease
VAISLVMWLWVPERRATRSGEPLAAQLRGLGALLRDPAFVRLAVCVGTSQSAAVALQTLWIAIWLRDVAGWSPAEVARGLLAVNLSMVAGYLAFGRAADARQRRGRNALPLLAGGVAIASLSLGAIVLGVRWPALWCVFVGAATAVVLAYSMLARRYPKEMAGRVNTTVNVVGFVGMFAGQWGIGAVLSLWPPSAGGYAPEGYSWALGMVWVVQLGGLAWLWAGRRLYAV